MKLVLSIALAAVACWRMASAAPHDDHRKFHVKKYMTTEVVTDWTTVLVPEYVVWVDGSGSPVSTETRTGSVTPATPTPEAVITPTEEPTPNTTPVDTSAASAADATPVPPPTTPAAAPTPAAPPTTEVSAPAAPAATTPAVEAAVTSSAGDSDAKTVPIQGAAGSDNVGGTGAKNPYQNGAADTSNNGDKSAQTSGSFGLGIDWDALVGWPDRCKTEAEVASDAAKFKNDGYSTVRLYMSSCSQIAFWTKYATQQGLSLFVSIEDIENVQGDLDTILSQAGSNLGCIDTIGIGNEVISEKGGDLGGVLGALQLAKDHLGGKFSGNIVTVENDGMHDLYHELCDASAFCAVNCHAWYAKQTSAGAGDYVAGVARSISAQHGGKRTVITESGWPWQGLPLGNGVASPQDQATALYGLIGAFPNGDLFTFQAYDTPYKKGGDPTQVENWFGIYH